MQELKAILRTRADQFTRNLAEKLLTYALGRGLETYDRSAVETLQSQAAADDHRFSSLVLGVVHSEPFRLRRGEEPTP